ncbi:MAG: H-X9-DG-CTERM domain-containing protein, partial [Gemmataceae bacterium]
ASRMVAFVESSKPVVDVVGSAAPDFWPTVAAPRHMNTLNVLFGDGHVEAMQLETIDPRVLNLQENYWRVSEVP